MTLQRPRPIEPTDSTVSFDSGEASLDRYLADRALANHVSDFARCYVCIDSESGRVVGYYTLSAIAVEHAELPGRARRNAPNPVPAVLLGRLAVDRSTQGSGLGRLLVRDAILSTLAAADRIGVRLLIVHARRGRRLLRCPRFQAFTDRPASSLSAPARCPRIPRWMTLGNSAGIPQENRSRPKSATIVR